MIGRIPTWEELLAPGAPYTEKEVEVSQQQSVQAWQVLSALARYGAPALSSGTQMLLHPITVLLYHTTVLFHHTTVQLYHTTVLLHPITVLLHHTTVLLHHTTVLLHHTMYTTCVIVAFR